MRPGGDFDESGAALVERDRFLRFERVGSVEETDRGLIASLHGEMLRVDVVRADVVRVKLSRGGEFDESPTFAVCVDPPADDVRFAVERREGVVRLRTSALVVSLWLDPFRLDVHRPDGTAVVETARDGAGAYWAYATLNDAFEIRRRCRPDDAFYGLGEKTGRHNRKGRDFTLWNMDVLDPVTTREFTAGRAPDDPRGDRTSVEFDPYYVSIPFFYHPPHPAGAMAASFVDNGYRATYDFAPAEEYAIRFEGGQYTEYIFAGPAMPDILAAYTWLTGRASLPPLWSLGYHQCRWHAYTQDAVEALGAAPPRAPRAVRRPVARHRVHGRLPRLHLAPGPLPRRGGDARRAWPSAASASSRSSTRASSTSPATGCSTRPSSATSSAAPRAATSTSARSGPATPRSPTSSPRRARAWWGELNAAHVRSGLAGIWNDMNEPATGAIPPDRMRFDRGRASHERFHNQYALLMAMGTVAGLREAMPELRTFVLSRAGFAGIQRYAANWMGDNLSRWDHLWLSVPMATGFGVSGQPFVGADVGGFFGHSNAELFVRWMQYGALTPFFRNHSLIGNVDQYAWSWGDAVLDLVRDAVELRYRLLPYLYAAFVQRDGDRRAGAAPAGVRPPGRRGGARHRRRVPARPRPPRRADRGRRPHGAPGLPAGRRLVRLACRRARRRSAVRARGAPMDRIPLYARGGAVIPMWPQAPPSTAGHHPRAIELHLFVPVAEGAHESLLQEDDGLTTAALDGRALPDHLPGHAAGGDGDDRRARRGRRGPDDRDVRETVHAPDDDAWRLLTVQPRIAVHVVDAHGRAELNARRRG